MNREEHEKLSNVAIEVNAKLSLANRLQANINMLTKSIDELTKLNDNSSGTGEIIRIFVENPANRVGNDTWMTVEDHMSILRKHMKETCIQTLKDILKNKQKEYGEV